MMRFCAGLLLLGCLLLSSFGTIAWCTGKHERGGKTEAGHDVDVIAKAAALFEKGQGDEALLVLKRVVGTALSSLDAYILRARIYGKMNDVEAQGDALQQALLVCQKFPKVTDTVAGQVKVKMVRERLYGIRPFQKVLDDMSKGYCDDMAKGVRKALKSGSFYMARSLVDEMILLCPFEREYRVLLAKVIDETARKGLPKGYLFNGKDLSGWEVERDKWFVEGNLLVGSSDGFNQSASIRYKGRLGKGCTLSFDLKRETVHKVKKIGSTTFYFQDLENKIKFSISIGKTVLTFRDGSLSGGAGLRSIRMVASPAAFVSMRFVFRDKKLSVLQGNTVLFSHTFSYKCHDRSLTIKQTRSNVYIGKFKLRS